MTARKFLTIMATAALALTAASCGDDNGSFNRDDVTRDVAVINHIVAPDGTASVEDNTFSYTFNVTQMTAGATLRATLGGQAATSSVSGLTLTTTDDGIYRFTASTTTGGVSNLVGVLNFNEASVRVTYEMDGYSIVTSLPEVFCLKSKTEVDYSADSVATKTQDDVMYQFEIDPATLTAGVKILTFTDQQRMRLLNIVSKADTPANVTVTSDGYDITASSISTTGTYQQMGEAVTTNIYTITNLKAHLNLYDNVLSLTCKLGDHQLTVTGTLSN